MYLKKNFLQALFTIFWLSSGLIYAPIIAGDFDDIDFNFPVDLAEEIAFDATVGPSCTDSDAQGLVELLIQDLDALCIFKQPFYLHTNELNWRSLLDYGLFLPQKFYVHPWTLGGHLFFNQTTRANFTRKSTALCTYLAIFNESLLDEIQKRISDFDPGISLPDVVPLFANTTVQERRTGFMFHGMHRWRDYCFRFLIPLYYLEANLFLTPEEIDDIEASLGVTDPADSTAFARKNLISDQIGFGDLRLNFDMPFAVTPHTTSKLGIQMTIPTAFAFRRGLYGSTFHPCVRGPILDFCNLFKLVEAGNIAELQAILLNYASAALDQFNANIIQTPLGNGGHFGLGLYLRSKTKLNSLIRRPWADNISVRGRMSVEYLFPHRQQRYFIECSSPGYEILGLNRAKAEILAQVRNDPAYARTVLAFLETQFTDKIFPFSLSTLVRPGVVFRWMTKYQYEADTDWGWYLGTDNWLTSREKLSKIHIPCGIPHNLNLKIAQKPFAYQFGIIGSLFWKRRHNLLASLNGQYNFGSVGVGNDFLISINLEKTF